MAKVGALSPRVPGWMLVLLCLMMGTFLGKLLQIFSLSAPLFRDLLYFGVDTGRVDLMAFSVGFSFRMDFNLGTFIGGVIGVWIAK
ncbi:hypothetical protein [Thermanaerovibrio acidaminovorans]|jgi:hypothetical protein|uniref:Uncharacterized protein n=1 Tax=Thermanaerovibrio acidaminovorans (strain ATCC 49978 / DSM 6589 / Su883) TaxID=525903 RepID=D1B8W4_THEAS|nr:hypothetical protein [Thermanaerovibrio acidaminovorans]ACZ18717.1 hypothetical protein Taci_0481 [Thermanaerovibrio acidaminovorans DSM 6589]